MVSSNLNFKCILILGPTASGKSALGHEIAKAFRAQNKPCALVNLDAFQIYKELNIGTAKPTRDEINKYNYHGIDVCNLTENLDANTFAKKTWDVCEELYKKNSIPICVGGSGLYLRAFLHGLDKLPMRDENLRLQIQAIAKEKGWPHCHEWLKQVDPKRASELHPNDKTRIERALEIFQLTGKPQSEDRTKENTLKNQTTLFPCFVIHCEQEKSLLKKRIHDRVQALFEQGWVEEVENLFLNYGEALNKMHAFQAIGYKEILNLIQSSHDSNEKSLMEKQNLIEKISTLTWHYAKKQKTWLAKEQCDFKFNYEEDNFSALFHELTQFREVT